MDSTIYDIEQIGQEWKSIPYGVPMRNQLAFVLDSFGHLVPAGVPGELYLRHRRRLGLSRPAGPHCGALCATSMRCAGRAVCPDR